ncbi:MAG TPA: ABC transporter permease [Burkholderiales bacterium]|nr:ABC transporter permease [Burkholderiales bacterium]
MATATLARLVLLEARRGGLPWLAAASLLLSVALAAFLSQVAVTESVALQLAVVGAALRACSVFLIATHVAASTAREISDKGLELMLALPLSRTEHYLGRLAGFAACGVALAVVFALPLALWAPAVKVLAWGISLAVETALVAAIALFFAMTLGQLVPALAATAGMYVLARNMPTIQLISTGPLAEESQLQVAARWLVDGVAFLLPPVDAMTRTAWLLYEPPGVRAYAAALGGAAVYGIVVAAAGLFDFHRRSV